MDIDKNNIPRHIAIVMDGNGRWAKQKGFQRIFGHKHAIEAVRDTIEGAGELGVGYLTLYAFSTENWNRPKTEVDALMGLLVDAIANETENLHQKNVKLSMIGNLSTLPQSVQTKLLWSINHTAGNTGLNLILAISYGSHEEITEAFRRILTAIENGDENRDSITPMVVEKYLETAGTPPPDLFIRTSGEQRISNFLLWQLAYTELYFTNVLWPDFRKKDLHKAIEAYQQRERRYGKTSEQMN